MTILVRRIEARARPQRVLIFDGPGISVEPSTMALFAERWESSLGVSIRVAASDGRRPRGRTPAAAEGSRCRHRQPRLGRSRRSASAGDPDRLRRLLVPADAGRALRSRPGRGHAGRTLDGYRWAIKYLLACCEWPVAIDRYGLERDQVAELRVPDGAGPHPVVVLIHGGAWKAIWRKDLMAEMAVDLARRGLASWNIEFRRLGAGGGWPTTFEDVSNAIGALQGLTEQLPLDSSRVVFVGHSSGGHLALWAAAKEQAPRRPIGVVSLAGISDLVEGARRRMFGGDNTVAELLGGGPDEVPERYATVSPRALLPLGVPQTLVQGLDDHLIDLVDQNRTHARDGAAAGDSVRLVEIEGATHMDLIEPSSAAWATVVREIEQSFM